MYTAESRLLKNLQLPFIHLIDYFFTETLITWLIFLIDMKQYETILTSMTMSDSV